MNAETPKPIRQLMPKPEATADGVVTRVARPDGTKEVVNWKAKVHFSTHRRFNWKERIAILFGYEIDIFTTIITERMPGKTAPKQEAIVTHLTQARDIVTTHRAYAELTKIFKLPTFKMPESQLAKDQEGSQPVQS